MIKRKDKLYTIGAILSAASIPLMGAQMIQSSGQAKEAEEQAEKQREVMRQQNDLLKKQNQKLDEIRKSSPNVAAIASQAIQKSFAAMDLVSNVFKAGKSAFGGSIKSNIISGVATGVGTYGAAKYLQNKSEKEQNGEGSNGSGVAGKVAAGVGTLGLGLLAAKKGVFGNSVRLATNKQIMKAGNAIGSNTLVRSGMKDYQKGAVKNFKSSAKSGLPKGQDLSPKDLHKAKVDASNLTNRTMNDLGISKDLIKKPDTPLGKTTEFIRNHKGSISMGVGFGAAPIILAGSANKSAQGDQVEKTYSALGSVASFWKNSKVLPGASFSNHLSNLTTMGLGGTKNIQKFGNQLINLGKGGSGGAVSNATVKVGEWIKAHPTAANYASIVPGVGVGALTFDGATKLVNKVGKTVDPNAYKQIENQNQVTS